MSREARRPIGELLAEARELVGARRILAETLEAQAGTWKKQLSSHPPTSERDMEHYRAKATQFRQLAQEQLDNVGDVGTLIRDLIAPSTS